MGENKKQAASPGTGASSSARTGSLKDLKKRASGGFLFLLLVMAALLFLPAWTLSYWQHGPFWPCSECLRL